MHWPPIRFQSTFRYVQVDDITTKAVLVAPANIRFIWSQGQKEVWLWRLGVGLCHVVRKDRFHLGSNGFHFYKSLRPSYDGHVYILLLGLIRITIHDKR